MITEKTILVIDAGNTSIKIGVFVNSELTDVLRFSLDSINEIEQFLRVNSYEDSVIASVLGSADTKKITSRLNNFLLVDSNTPTPIKNKYQTQNTLGTDRLCNAVGVASLLQSSIGVCIDIGTCIKFDVINSNQEYLGGSISPGIDLRYKSLNDYTGNLPLLSNKSTTKLVGEDTNKSIQSGVLNGIDAEINGLMSSYSEQFDDLTFFVTGGDASFFDLDSKNDIFANENLTLLGLFEIYRHNA